MPGELRSAFERIEFVSNRMYIIGRGRRGDEIFSNQQLGTKAYMKLKILMELDK
jgi:hypothetical protein